jgi:hypothetical protein
MSINSKAQKLLPTGYCEPETQLLMLRAIEKIVIYSLFYIAIAPERKLSIILIKQLFPAFFLNENLKRLPFRL